MENTHSNPTVKGVLQKIRYYQKHYGEDNMVISQGNVKDLKFVNNITAHKSPNYFSIMKRIRKSLRFTDRKTNTITANLIFIRWSAMIAQILLASSLPALLVLSTVEPLLKGLWRFIIGMFILFPIVFYEIWSGKYPHIYSFENLFDFKLQLNTFISSVFFCGWGSLPLISYKYACALHVNIFNNLQIVIIFTFMMLIGYKVPIYGYFGFIAFAFGIGLVLSDNSIKSKSGVNFQDATVYERFMYGYLLSLISSFCAAFYFVMSNKVAKKYTVYSLSLFMAIYICIILLPLTYIFEGSRFNFSPENGIFNLFSTEQLPIYIAIGSVGVFVLVLSSFVLTVFDPFILNALQVVKPILGSYIVSIFGIQSFPGERNLFGCLFVFIGLYFLLISQVQSSDQTEKKMSHKSSKEIPMIIYDKSQVISHHQSLGVDNISDLKERETEGKSGYYFSMI